MREPKTNLQEIMATHDGASFFDFDQRDTSTPQRQQMSQPNFNDTVASRTSRFDASQAEFTLEAQEIEEGQSRPKPEWKTRLNQTTFTQRDVTETIASPTRPDCEGSAPGCEEGNLPTPSTA